MNERLRTSSLETRLRPLVSNGDAEGVLALLQTLSVAEKRKADTLLANTLLQEMQDAATFWGIFDKVVQSLPKAYLVTFLKAATVLYKKGVINFKDDAVRKYSTWMSAIDRRKTMSAFLPLMETPQEVDETLHAFSIDNPEEKISILPAIRTMPCRYELFNALKMIEGEEGKIRNCCLVLMKQGERFSYNLASIISQYFAIDNLPGTFSLRMKPYEQSRLDGSYENFCKLMKSI